MPGERKISIPLPGGSLLGCLLIVNLLAAHACTTHFPSNSSTSATTAISAPTSRKNFSSKIRLMNPTTGEDREDLIYMNHPLRYQGLTFYQSGFANDDTTTNLQVVKNPVWTLPYISCAMLSLGLLWVFLGHLLKAIARRKKAAAP